jgi:hypothetical protein
MRGLAGAVVIALGLNAGAVPAQSLPPGVTPQEAHAGCMHTDLRSCMITLGMVLSFDMTLVAKQIAKRNELDVNGKTAHRAISIVAQMPGHHDSIAVVLTLASPAPNDMVIAAEYWPFTDPDTAHTQSEYDSMFLYDVVSALLGTRCPSLDRLGLYRFYENSLKPLEIVKTEIFKRGIFNHTVQTVDTDKVAFCGVRFSVHKRSEFDGVPDSPASRAPKSGTYILLE